MHVVIVSPYNPRPTPGADAEALVGGVEVALDASASALVARGHDVTIACSSTTRGVDVREDGVRVVRVQRHGTLFRAPLSSLPFHVGRPDVVHVPATYPTVSDLVPLACRARRIPVVLDYHFDAHPTSRAMDFATRAYYRSLAHGMRAADLYLAKTREYARKSPFARHFPEERLREVPNGVDVDRFDVSPGPERGYVLCVGRLVPYKGVRTLVDAMKRVQEHVDAPLWVVGNGPLRAELEARAREMELDARFLGFVPDADLPALYAGAAVTVLPSANGQEAFGITLLESMAAGTPVVASDLPGVRQVARLGGLTVPPRDPAALADALKRIVKGDADVPRGDALKRRARETFGWPAIARTLEDAYGEAIGVSRSRRGGRAP